MSDISPYAMELLEKVIDDKIATSLNRASQGKSQHRATVLAKDNQDILWVSIPGMADNIPVDVTLADAMANDTVHISMENGMVILDGNETSPAANVNTVGEVINSSLGMIGASVGEYLLGGDSGSLILDYIKAEIAHIDYAEIANAVVENARIQNLLAEKADINFTNVLSLNAEEALIHKADIDRLISASGWFESLTAEDLEAGGLHAKFADIDFANVLTLDAANAHVHQAAIDNLVSAAGIFDSIRAESGDIGDLRSHFADIDFANIKTLIAGGIDTPTIRAIRENVTLLMAESAYIDRVVGSQGSFTDYLTGVKIDGDIIKANTIIADKIIYPGESGMYYMLNYHGGYTPVINTLGMNPMAEGYYEQRIVVEDGKERLRYVLTSDTVADVYEEVTPSSSANPHESGYYEYDSGTDSYVPSEDTSLFVFVPISEPSEDLPPSEMRYYEYDDLTGEYSVTEDQYLVHDKTYYALSENGKTYYVRKVGAKKYYAKTEEDLPLDESEYQAALDGSRIVANSITAHELNVENVTATGNAFMKNLQTRLLEADQVRVGANGTMHILISKDPSDPTRAELGFYNGNDEAYVLVKPEEGSDPSGYYVVSFDGSFVSAPNTPVAYDYLDVGEVLDENDPSSAGYYEYDDQNDVYILTQDAAPVDGKTYYDYCPVPNYYELQRNYDARVAFVDGYRLMIPYSVVLNQMILGEWAWTYRKNGNMDLVYIGSEG